ncbi:MAG TPA: PIN domain-containing protein [Jatrophihabitans sp.]|uniref:PIN domain-containing protein n=1 Tax=Jatrophihabitans sp. TaxID=1932789 RepID=UPI002F16AA75
MTTLPRGLLDTSVFIATESGRFLDTALLPDEAFISVITIGELHAGVLAAKDTRTRAVRLATLEAVAALEPLPVDAAAAAQWATLRVRLAEEGHRAKVNDLWIAAIAAANNLTVVTQDDDFEPIEAVGGPPVVRV